MSEEKSSFMSALDLWTVEEVIKPLSKAVRRYLESLEEDGEPAYSPDAEKAILETHEALKKAIRAKVLESYRNGQTAGPRKRS